MERIWLKSYRADVPAEADVDAFSSIVNMFDQSVARFANEPAYIHMGVTLTYAEVDRLSRNFAAYLHEKLRLPKGVRLALMMPNILQYPIALFGALRAGCTVVNCNPLYTPRELEQQLADLGAEAIVVLENLRGENFGFVLQEELAQTKVRHVIVTQFGGHVGMGQGEAN